MNNFSISDHHITSEIKMGNENSVPVMSQVKSLCQAIEGDMEGARETQIDFIRRCPVVSQLNSLGMAMVGDNEEALKIQEEFAEHNQEVPVLGHGIAAGYAACGQMDKAIDAAIFASISIPLLIIILLVFHDLVPVPLSSISGLELKLD